MLTILVFWLANGDANGDCAEANENVLDVDVTAFEEVTAGGVAAPNWKVDVFSAAGFKPKLNVDVAGEPKLNCDFTADSIFPLFSLDDVPSFGVLQHTHSLSV